MAKCAPGTEYGSWTRVRSNPRLKNAVSRTLSWSDELPAAQFSVGCMKMTRPCGDGTQRVNRNNHKLLRRRNDAADVLLVRPGNLDVSDLTSKGAAKSPLTAALQACRSAFVAIGMLTGFINVLMLSGSLFMLQVYDRVLPSRNVPTLIALFVLVTGLYAFQGVLDMTRGRILVRIGAFLDEQLSARVYDVVVRLPLKTQTSWRIWA